MNPSAGQLRRGGRGVALVYVMIIMLLVVPVMLALARRAAHQNRINVKDWQQKSARGLALNVPFDYMRQFFQRPFIDYSDTAQFDRPELFYSVGFSTVTFNLQAADRSLHIRATGKYGRDAQSPLAAKTLDAVLKFNNDMLQYSRFISRSLHFIVGATNISYQGGYYSSGIDVDEWSSVVFNGGPVVINGGVNIRGNVLFNANVYYSDPNPNWGSAAFAPGAAAFPFVFNVQLPPTDPSYYLTNNNYNVSAVSQTWTFGFNTTSNQPFFSIAELGDLQVFYPANGAILVAQNSVLRVRGPVHGRVAIVCTGTGVALGTPQLIINGTRNVQQTGNVIFDSDFQYCHGAGATADPNHAFMVIASSFVVFAAPSQTTPLLVSGVMYSMNTNIWGALLDVPGGLIISGVSANGIQYQDYPGIQITFQFDPGLARNPPPGLPETPRVVSLKPGY